MKKFSFSMVSILNARVAQKEAREHELVAAQRNLREEEERLNGIVAKINSALYAEVPSNPDGRYFVQKQKYVSMLKRLRRQQQTVVNKAMVAVQLCLNKLREADIELKKMEKLQERESASWTLATQREDQKQSDEIGTTLAFFNKMKI
ncbi:MAG: flagellar export protein FliJ [Victivallales bacterium]|nr:flagellar export protein FliJ [Victivallales bacterium]